MIKAIKHFGLALCLAGTLLVVGCNSQTPPPEIHQGKVGGGNDTSTPAAAAASTATESPATGAVVNAPPAGGMPQMPPGGMTKDPRSITEVVGKVVEVQETDIFVQKGPVNLKFHLTPGTVIKPDGKKLAADQTVKIEIEHVADGMNAKEIDIQ